MQKPQHLESTALTRIAPSRKRDGAGVVDAQGRLGSRFPHLCCRQRDLDRCAPGWIDGLCCLRHDESQTNRVFLELGDLGCVPVRVDHRAGAVRLRARGGARAGRAPDREAGFDLPAAGTAREPRPPRELPDTVGRWASRRYCRITTEGRHELAGACEVWRQVAAGVDAVIACEGSSRHGGVIDG